MKALCLLLTDPWPMNFLSPLMKPGEPSLQRQLERTHRHWIAQQPQLPYTQWFLQWRQSKLSAPSYTAHLTIWRDLMCFFPSYQRETCLASIKGYISILWMANKAFFFSLWGGSNLKKSVLGYQPKQLSFLFDNGIGVAWMSLLKCRALKWQMSTLKVYNSKSFVFKIFMVQCLY